MTYDEYRNLLATNPNVRKVLDVISIMEGSSTFADPYRAMGGTRGKLFTTGFDNHPTAYGQGKWEYRKLSGGTGPSTANGKYAFIYPTWKGLQKQFGGRLKFDPEGQDIAALELIRQRGQLQNLINGNYRPLINALGHTWASLPSAPDHYDQARGSWDKLARAFTTVGLDPKTLGMNGTYAPISGHRLNNGYRTGTTALSQMAGGDVSSLVPWQHQPSTAQQSPQREDLFSQRVRDRTPTPSYAGMSSSGLVNEMNDFELASQAWQRSRNKQIQNNDLLGF